MRTIQFLFDFLSPYAYIAWHELRPIAERHTCEIEPVPVLLAALLNANGQRGPAEIPNKRIYVFKDSYRSAALAGLPLVPPPSHPFNPLLALRAASVPLPAEARRRFLDALWQRTWAGGGGVESAEDVAEAARLAGLVPEEILAAAASPAIKVALRAQTEAALAAGAFGVPSFLIDGELFWGCDSLRHLDRFLDGSDPLAGAKGRDELARWSTLPASAQRS